MSYYERKYYRGLAEAEYILEKHTLAETAEEFRVSKTTVANDLNYIRHYARSREEAERNERLFERTKKQLMLNAQSPKQ